MAELHDRMPVILAESDWPKWLGEVPATEDELMAMLKPCPDDVLKIWPVGKAVGNVKNKGSDLCSPSKSALRHTSFVSVIGGKAAAPTCDRRGSS
jgi:putative SOS response-associated peptidase YedK